MANPEEKFDYMFKMLFVGDSKAGKTAFLTQYTDGRFIPTFVSTVGIDFKVKNVTRDDKKIKLQMWDTSGQERYRQITTAYYDGANGFIIMFDLSDDESFHRVSKWVSEVLELSLANAPIILVGNKSDLTAAVTREQVDQVVQSLDVQGYFETSAKNNVNVTETMDKLIDLMFNNAHEESTPEEVREENDVVTEEIPIKVEELTENVEKVPEKIEKVPKPQVVAVPKKDNCEEGICNQGMLIFVGVACVLLFGAYYKKWTQ